MLALADGVAATLAAVVVFAWAGANFRDPALLVLVPLIVGIHKIAGLYDRDDLVLRRSTLDEMPALLQVSSVYTLFVAAVERAAVLGTPPRAAAVRRPVARRHAADHGSAHRRPRLVARLVAPDERCLVVGDADRIEHVCEKLDAASRRGRDVVAAIGVRRSERSASPGVEDLRALIEHHDVHRVVIAPASHDARRHRRPGPDRQGGRRARQHPAARARGRRLLGRVRAARRHDDARRAPLRPQPLVAAASSARSTSSVGTICLVAVLPLFAVIALAVRLDSRGPVFFRQTRIGRDGRPFRIWKFRSMVDGRRGA